MAILLSFPVMSKNLFPGPTNEINYTSFVVSQTLLWVEKKDRCFVFHVLAESGKPSVFHI